MKDCNVHGRSMEVRGTNIEGRWSVDDDGEVGWSGVDRR